ncbi:predicted protein, partial [Nematostella vectensis]
NLTGCANKPHPLGMEDGRIQDTSITVSSTYSSPGDNPHHARLNNQPVKGEHIGAWGAADLQTKDEYLQVDLGRVTWITHVATQGRPIEHAQWVTEYSVDVHNGGIVLYVVLQFQFAPFFQVFPGNFDQTTVVKNELFPVIKTRYVRIVVQASNGNVVMRAELYGLECSFT